MRRLRSIAFSVSFPLLTGLYCIVLAFGPLLPRKGALWLTLFWLKSVAWLERTVLGLDYRIIGGENLPKQGAFIVAAKHQSAFETMKVHLILKDPAIVMKAELLRVPIWGSYTRRTGMIPIDRAGGRAAMSVMLTAARARAAEARPIVIFPQGTRVAPGERRAYKSGVIALYNELRVPIVPLALDSGFFWPKHGMKHGGVVTFSFLPPIEPGKPSDEALALLEQRLEAETDRLIAVHESGSVSPVAARA